MNYVIANSRVSNKNLQKSLEKKTGHSFFTITHKESLLMNELNKINPRYIFFPHWSHIIPKEIYTSFECVIFHMTDLPYGRGGSPLQNLILRGDVKTQLCAFRCEAGIDTGPIYMKRPLNLEGSASEIFKRANQLIKDMIINIINYEPIPSPQEGTPVIFSRRVPSESNLENAKIYDLKDFYNFIRMLDAEGYPKAFIYLHKHKLEFSRVEYKDGKVKGTFSIQKYLPELGSKL
jgi:methionyl-tRNA formyltransferase